MKEIIPIVHMFNDNYTTPAAVAFASMLHYANPKYYYKLYVMTTDIAIEHQQKLLQIVAQYKNADITFISMDNKLPNIYINPINKDRYTQEIFYKLLLPSFFPQYDRVILTDVDVVYAGDIAKSWEMTKTNHDFYLAGVRGIDKPNSWLDEYKALYEKDFTRLERDRLKIGAGYLIFNLKNMRTDNVEAQFMNYLNKNAQKLIQPEQDVMNIVCPNDKKIYLPLNNTVCTYVYDLYENTNCEGDNTYTAQALNDALTAPVQIHYAGAVKPWNSPNCTKADVWYYWLAQTPFFYDHMKNSKPQDAVWYCGPIPCIKLKNGRMRMFKIFKLHKKQDIK